MMSSVSFQAKFFFTVSFLSDPGYNPLNLYKEADRIKKKWASTRPIQEPTAEPSQDPTQNAGELPPGELEGRECLSSLKFLLSMEKWEPLHYSGLDKGPVDLPKVFSLSIFLVRSPSQRVPFTDSLRECTCANQACVASFNCAIVHCLPCFALQR